MPRRFISSNVFEAAIDRICWLYKQGHRPVVSLSGGKDSTAVLGCTVMAAEKMGRLPVDAVMRDDEIMYPGTFEYLERVHDDPRVNLQWIWAGQPVLNIFNRALPYFWVFDPQLKPEQWVRQPPAYGYKIPEINIQYICTLNRFPAPPGKETVNLVGIRASESPNRRKGVFSINGWLTSKGPPTNIRQAWPIYDWYESDIWKVIHDNDWDYNHAYDVFWRHGIGARRLRIAPPTMSTAGINQLQIGARVWPNWFDRVAQRLPGIRSVVQFGRRVVEPYQRLGETWEEVYRRDVAGPAAPDWIRPRGQFALQVVQAAHSRHAGTTKLPEVRPCSLCPSGVGSWRDITFCMWDGDPFSQRFPSLPYVEPETFRAGFGTRWHDYMEVAPDGSERTKAPATRASRRRADRRQAPAAGH